MAGTLKLAIDKIDGLAVRPDLLLHTGDITHSAKPAEFDTAQQMIKGAKAGEIFYVPGEHDIATDDGALYRERFGKGAPGVASTALAQGRALCGAEQLPAGGRDGQAGRGPIGVAEG